MSFNTYVKEKEENIRSSILVTSKDMEGDQCLSGLSKHKTNSNERFPSIILEENEDILQKSSTNKSLNYLFPKYKNKSSNSSQQKIQIHQDKPSNLYFYLEFLSFNNLFFSILEKLLRELVVQLKTISKKLVHHLNWYY
jgi:hypothetical protein